MVITKCHVNFQGALKKTVEGIYNAILQNGESCEKIDQGYTVVNYAGIHCADSNSKTCIKGSGDGVLESSEVLEYVLNNYEKYREIIEGQLNLKLPWVLDDLDPKTDFDTKIREQVQTAIDALDKILKAKGLVKGSAEYNEKLAVGLHWFVAMPVLKSPLDIPLVNQRIADEMKKDGLEDFTKYLQAKGGLRVDGDYSREYSALDAIRFHQGECTEMSKILYAVLKMAHLNPQFLDVEIYKEKPENVYMLGQYLVTPRNISHVCIALKNGDRMRMLDPTLLTSDATYQYYRPLSLRLYLSEDYSGLGAAWFFKNDYDLALDEYDKGVALDPDAANIYENRSITFFKKGDYDRAIVEARKGIKIHPKRAELYCALANALREKGELDKAIEAFIKATEVDTQYAVPYSNLGVVWQMKNDLDKAFYYYNKAVELDSKDAVARSNRGNIWGLRGKLDLAIQDYTASVLLDPKRPEPYMNGLVCRWLKGQSNEAIDDAATLIQMTNGRLSEIVVAVAFSFSMFVSQSAYGKQQKIAKQFKIDTGIEMGKFTVHALTCYALWKGGKHFMAEMEFDNVIGSNLALQKHLSPSTKKYFHRVLSAMPDKMSESDIFGEALKKLKRKIR
ncbi:MAG: hypothetical protein COV45_09050 [Deltaproteobacteria bacterium CG11_big_fil_rev_8_21_14_0_20_47_16]|nr:MAG: hypothetical protein COV45_09050 [Deltaproteobacteria bacterium CG11_big_fil_rev_8_21_14_0_20_47_16]